jgi:ADP-heptose:LPS heptosyltransferase
VPPLIVPQPRRRPLIVRLRNWVGDTTLGVPLLQRLDDAGYALQLVGKGWARDLLGGHGWPVHVQPGGLRERVALLRRLKADALLSDDTFRSRINAVCLPYSFSSALDMRLAGLRALGHAHEGRSPLLSRAVPRPQGLHELEVYWDLGNRLLDQLLPRPAQIGLRLSITQEQEADALLQANAIRPGFIVICPFAGGTWAKQDKTWPAFAQFANAVLPGFSRDIVICPGPGEEVMSRAHFACAVTLPNVGLGAYAALLKRAAVMVANDTGPGHIAAAVGTPLVSVLGPSDPTQWRAWGSNVRLLQGPEGWPAVAAVERAVADVLNAA